MVMGLKNKLLNIAKKRKLNDKEIKLLLESIKDPWEEARGILKLKKKTLSPLKYQRKVRSEWKR